MNTGLSDEDTQLIINTIKRYSAIQHAKIFGSRAKGNYKAGSDIDIALYIKADPETSQQTVLNLQQALEEELTIPYFFDIVDVSNIENKALKEHIERVGVLLC